MIGSQTEALNDCALKLSRSLPEPAMSSTLPFLSRVVWTERIGIGVGSTVQRPTAAGPVLGGGGASDASIVE